VGRVKIQLKGQFSVDRTGGIPISVQIVRQVQQAIEAGRLTHGTQLPSSRALARTLRLSRNTVLTAFDELKARGLLLGHRGARMRVIATSLRPRLNVRRVMREAQYPLHVVEVRDQDGNPILISYESRPVRPAARFR
jgi:GntR family transcriptional regulator/MocR family aminotransferase